MKHIPSNIYQIVAAGGTLTVTAGNPTQSLILYSGTTTLLAGVLVNQSGTFREGDTIYIHCYLTGLSNGGFTLTILGETISSTLYENSNLFIVARYSAVSGKFIISLFPDFQTGAGFIGSTAYKDSSITTNKLENNAVTYAKLQALTGRGYLIRGGAAGAGQDFDAKTSGNLIGGDGTDVKSMPVTGDVTIAHSGGNLVTTIGAGVIEESMLAFTLASYLEVTKTLTSAEVLTLYSANINTGYEFIAAPGANKYIEIVSATAMQNYGTTTYASPGTLNIECNNVALWTFPEVALVEATADTVNQGTRVDSPIIALNTAVRLHIDTSNPITGDGTITVKAIYRICDFV